MMKSLFTLLAIFLISVSTFAQQGINYKALIKDDLGNVVAGQAIGVQFQIRETTANGSVVYTETHSPTTDTNGIMVLTIGTGDTSDTFSAIDWSSDDHWLNLQIDLAGGTNYADISTTQFMAVPYALHAANVSGLEAIDQGNGIGWRIKGRDPINFGFIGLNAMDLSYGSYGATGDYSTAMGESTHALGDYSTAMGSNTNSNGVYSTAMGQFTDASGDYSTAMGFSNVASGDYSIASGHSTQATGINSATFGRTTQALGDYSTAFGRTTRALGDYSIAMGRDSEAQGNFSIAMGHHTQASGHYSTAMGSNTEAIGEYSTVMGRITRASGYNSTAMGRSTTAKSYAETAIGLYNTNYTPNNINAWDENDRLFVIGNGETGSTRSDALIVLKNGNVITGGSLTIQRASDVTSSWRFETRPNGSLSMYRNGEYRGFFSESTGNYSSISDRRAKKNITSLENGTLNKVMQLNPVSYLMKDQTSTKRNLGLISQEVQAVFPSITNYVKESDLLTLSYTELIPILIKALQEQQVIIEAQEAKDIIQDKSIEDLIARLNLIESKSTN